ncbi:MAG: NADPH-dependent oxidoreductase [Proteobacteria bacterium]|nr:NADPH-dependent oxidoreductase [Pseudomonadota bacterium]
MTPEPHVPDTIPLAPPPDAADLLHRRHRVPAAPPPGWNDVLATMLAHRSVRHFRPDPLPAGTLELLVTAAQSASTSSNLQLWSVVAVAEPARKVRLAQLAGQQAFIAQAPLLLVWLADLHRLEALAAARGVAVEGTQFLEEFVVGVVDAALAAQNALTAAESLGLGGVYVGAMRNLPEQVATELALPPHVFAVFGMAIGWPDPAVDGDIKPRLPIEVVLHREQYRAAPDTAEIGRYDTTLHGFQREQGMREVDWTAQCIARVKDAAALRGRDRLRAALRALGFALR